mgnify:FL=1
MSRIKHGSFVGLLPVVACLVFLAISIVGCKDPAVVERLNASKGNINQLTRSHSHPFWQQIYGDVRKALEKSTRASLNRPRIAAAGTLKRGNARSLFVYWIEATPSVENVRLIDTNGRSVLSLQVGEASAKQNIEEARKVVVFSASFLWKGADVPSVLSSNALFATVGPSSRGSEYRVPLRRWDKFSD